MLRSVLGVVVGAIAWIVGFYLLAMALMLVWPEYAVYARQFRKDGSFIFTPPTAVCNLIFWVLGEVFAGWVAMKIAKRREAVWALAAILGAFLAYMHLIRAWSILPWWYNLGVAIPASVAVLFGGRLGGGSRKGLQSVNGTIAEREIRDESARAGL
jgi:hypothetical protein